MRGYYEEIIKATLNMKRYLLLIIILVVVSLPFLYFFFFLPLSVYPAKNVSYSVATFDDSYWAMSPTNNGNTKLSKLPSNYSSINKYFQNAITANQKASLLSNGFVNIPGKFYQSFSSYYYDLLAAKVPVFVTSDSVINYSYNMISTLRKTVVEKELIPIYTKWLDRGIDYFGKLKDQNKGKDDITKLCDINITIFNETRKTLGTNPTFDTYVKSYSYLTEQYTKQDNPNAAIVILLYNKRSNDNLFSKILTVNSIFGISSNDLGLKSLDQDITSKTKRYSTITEILKLEESGSPFIDNEATDSSSFYDSVFSNIENNWGDNTQYTYRKNIVGDIYSTNVEEDRWTSVKGLDSQIAIEKDLTTYRLLLKYFGYLEDTLKKENILTSETKKTVDSTLDDISFLTNCSNNACISSGNKTLTDFFKNAGAINNTSQNNSLLVTEGIFEFNNFLYVGPVYDNVTKDFNDIKGNVLGASLFGNFNSGYDYAVRPQPKGSVRIPVLMYHNIAPLPRSSSSFVTGLYVSPTMFAQQMAYLKQKGYQTITASQFLTDIKSGKNPSNKTVMITFDDGTRPQYTVAYPILKKYNFKAVYFIIASRLLISAKELKLMSDNGMDIESHSLTHPDLSKIGDPNRLKSELNRSKLTLEGITGKKIVSIAYPGCVGGQRVFNLLKKYGYQLGFSCGSSIDHYYAWWYNLSRVHVFNDMYKFKKALSWGL